MLEAGTAVLLVRQNENGQEEILLGKRLSKEGYGLWAMPGGKIEDGEMPNEAASRELLEETGIYIHPNGFEPWTFLNGQKSNGIRYTTLFLFAEYNGDDIVNNEPEKTVCWQWFNFPKARNLDLWDNCKEVINRY